MSAIVAKLQRLAADRNLLVTEFTCAVCGLEQVRILASGQRPVCFGCREPHQPGLSRCEP